MVNFIEYIDNCMKKHNITDEDFKVAFSKILVGNKWFGAEPVLQNGQIFVEEQLIKKIEARVEEFCLNYNKDDEQKLAFILDKFDQELPKTSKLYREYIKHIKLNNYSARVLADFLVYNLVGELPQSDDREIGDLLGIAYDELSKVYSDILVGFINRVKVKTKTVYQDVYTMNPYYDADGKNDAYAPDSYLDILFHLFNEDYIDQNDMYICAAHSKNYTDTWLYLSLHFLCALRNTDLLRIPRPRLVSSPEETLKQIEENTFSDKDAMLVFCSVIWHLEALMLKPKKTSATSNVSCIKFHVPDSVQVHIGKLFALAEAHSQINNEDKDVPLIRIIKTYEQINRYMGEDIGDLFLEADFRSRAANKSYLQMVYLLSDDILGINDEFKVKGYMLAALARSHKGSYAEFAQTTGIYLKDAKMSGYTPGFVARELLERGVLSLVPLMLLKTIAGEEYNKMSVESQTKVIKALNMSPNEVDKAVAIMQVNMNRSTALVKEIYKNCNREKILEVLHRIGNSQAASKCDGSLCLMSAMKNPCPYPDNQNCISCEYEISTKTTMFLMVQECRRLKRLHNSTDNEMEKKRAKAIATNVVAPAINEMLTVVKEQYGEEGLRLFEEIVMEGTNA